MVLFQNIFLFMLNWFKQVFISAFLSVQCSICFRYQFSTLNCLVFESLPLYECLISEMMFCRCKTGHCYVFLIEVETVWAALCMCLEIQKVRIEDGDSSPCNCGEGIETLWPVIMWSQIRPLNQEIKKSQNRISSLCHSRDLYTCNHLVEAI